MIKRAINKACKLLMTFPRKMYYKKKIKQLENKDFTIIANNCFATFIYHDLGLRFNSPTINLFFHENRDFIEFAANLKEYLAVELVEVHGHDKKYPVGTLTYNGYTVTLNFMHYHSFEEAKAKWDERKKRVNYDNIFLVLMTGRTTTQEIADSFAALPYKNKMMISGKTDVDCKHIVKHPVFDKPDYKNGELFQHKSLFSLDRHMDDIDYIGFLNGKYSD